MNTRFATTESEIAGWRGLRNLVETVAASVAPRELVALNAGAGTSDALERVVSRSHPNIRFDRVDIVDSAVEHPAVRNTFRCSVENMSMVADNAYDVVVALWLLEHLRDLAAALSEFNRVLRPGGCFVATVPNPIAPEFLIARFTPTKVHRLLHTCGFETHYSYGSVGALVELARRSGLETTEVVYSPDVASYLGNFVPWLAPVGRAYDHVVLRLRIQSLLGQCVVSMHKRQPRDPM